MGTFDLEGGRSRTLSAAPCFGIPQFSPLFVDDYGLLVTGSPLGLEVFLQHEGSSVSSMGTIAGTTWISGFGYHAGALFVQDGAVLTRWDLTGDQVAQGPSYDLSQGAAAGSPEQAATLTARYREAWGTLLAAAEAEMAAIDQQWSEMPEEGGLKPPSPSVFYPPGLQELANDVRALLQPVEPSGPGGYWNLPSPPPPKGPDPLGLPALTAARIAAEAAAPQLLFSAPVIQQLQVDSNPTQTVWVLGGDGTLYALGKNLDDATIIPTGGAAVPQLCGWEPSDPQGFGLFFPTPGGISLMDVSDPQATDPPVPPGSVPVAPAGTPQLPLAATAGLLWGGGGTFGSTFFAMPLPVLATGTAPQGDNAPWQPRVQASGAWTDYAVLDGADPLGLLTDGTNTTLLGAAATSGSRSRWGVHAAPDPSWTVFVPAPAAAGLSPPPPPLVLEVDQAAAQGAAGVGYRLYPANTADDPRGLASFPPPSALVSGALSLQQNLPRAVLTRPVVPGDALASSSLYLVGAPMTAAEQLTALCGPANGTWSSFYPTASASAAPPLLPGGAYVYVWQLQPFSTAVADPLTQSLVPEAASAYVQQMEAVASRVAIQLVAPPDVGLRVTDVTVQIYDRGNHTQISRTTDGSGVIELDDGWFGHTVDIYLPHFGAYVNVELTRGLNRVDQPVFGGGGGA